MTTYVLVHGAWHGGWCWHRVVARLRQASHRVFAPDLKSLGRDRTPPGGITLDTWTDQIAALVQSQSEPVVLAGHSLGGIILSEVAERIPEQVRTLVYVAAYLLESGRSLRDAGREDADSLVGRAMVVAPDRLSVSIREDAVREALYGQCSDADVVLAKSLLVPQPLAPLSVPARLTDARFGRVPRVYVECTEDRAITHAAQRRMQDGLPCRRRFTLESDHSPFFSHDEKLADMLASIPG
ncbi:MAG TPA: alpha/beta fold hydrolase [Steroidobacteraceae bacterium]|nr:alpha/beta fold hydrolase [Steroidobacteraceae bacterium]